MAAVTQDELQPQGYSDMLAGSGQQFAPPGDAPTQGGLGGLITGAQDGWSAASDWVKNSPSKAQALMQVFSALAQNGHGSRMGQIGHAIGQGNTFMLAQQQADQQRGIDQHKQDQADAKQAADITNQEQGRTNEQARIGNDERRVGNDERRVTAEESNTDSLISNRAATTAQTQQTTQQSGDLFPLKQKQLTLQLDVVDKQLRAADDAHTISLLTAKREQIANALSQVNLKVQQATAMPNAQANVAKNQIGVQTATEQARGAGLQNDSQVLANDAAERKNQAMSQMPLEVQAGVTPAKPKSIQERWEQHFKTASAALMPGQVLNQAAEMEKFRQNERTLAAGVGQLPDPSVAQQSVVKQGQEQPQALWEGARNSVQIGQKYKGPDGQLYIRKN